jgi:adenylate cyclase
MRSWPRLSFTVTVMMLFAAVFAGGVALVVWGFWATGQRAAITAGERTLAATAAAATARGRALLEPVLAFAAVLPDYAPLGQAGAPAPPELAQLLTLHPAVASVAALAADGTLRRLVWLDGATVAGMPEPPQAARFALVERRAEAVQARWTFLDAAFRDLGMRLVPWRGEEAADSVWARQARGADGVQVSPLHLLGWAQRPGLSISRAAEDGGAFTLDLKLDALSAFLAGLAADGATTAFVFLDEGILLAHPDPAIARPGGSWTTLAASADPLLRQVWAAFAPGQLRPGEVGRIAGAAGPTLVFLSQLPDLAPSPILVAVAAPLEVFTAPVRDGLAEGLRWAAAGMLVGLFAIGLVARRIAGPLSRLTREAEAIRGFKLDGPVPVRSHIVEINRLAGAMGAMKASLRTFGAYVPRDLVRQLMKAGGTAELGGERRALTVMFTDVEGFTSLAEPLEPEALMRVTSHYFEALTGTLLEHGATIDKYIGDAVMALWNAPTHQPQHALVACRAALAGAVTTRRLVEEFVARGWPPMATRFGVHTGEAVVGNVGSSDRMSYTAIGAMVNISSRLEALNKRYGTQILVSGAVRAAVGQACVLRSVDLVTVKGASQPIEVFELLGLAHADRAADDLLVAPAAARARVADWEAMVAHWRAGRFEGARAALNRLSGADTDPLVRVYAARLEGMPGEADSGWSPVIRMETK